MSWNALLKGWGISEWGILNDRWASGGRCGMNVCVKCSLVCLKKGKDYHTYLYANYMP